jgi:hypothetical protein
LKKKNREILGNQGGGKTGGVDAVVEGTYEAQKKGQKPRGGEGYRQMKVCICK